jgi:uncharacterized protein (TIGR02246 family)
VTYFHRTSRTTSLDWLRGRNAVAADDLADAVANADVPVSSETIDRVTVEHFHAGAPLQWSRHRWARYEGEFIIDETVIEDGSARCRAQGVDFNDEARRLAESPLHRPLGELRAGNGQFAAGAAAILPPGLPAAIRPLADAMHRAWNGRDVAALAELWADDVVWTGPDGAHGNRAAMGAWLARLHGTFDDGVLLFEDAVVVGDRVAILWRLHGHHSSEAYGVAPMGARIRLIGSTVVRFAGGRIVADETLFDPLAAAIQLRSAPIDY